MEFPEPSSPWVTTNAEIYIMNANGTGITRLTYSPDWDMSPTLSPDGTKIGFRSNRDRTQTGLPDGRYDLYFMNPNGGGQVRRNFIIPFEDSYSLQSLDWSPDGTQVVVSTLSAGINVMTEHGDNLTSLQTGNVGEPRWSPNGTKIAYAEGGTPGQLMVMNADGSDVTQITDSIHGDGGLDWSPDGTKLAFVTSAPHVIAVVNTDGTNRVNLTDGPSAARPVWSPDGTLIAYWQDGTASEKGIYVMNANGSNPTQVTFGRENVTPYSWSP